MIDSRDSVMFVFLLLFIFCVPLFLRKVSFVEKINNNKNTSVVLMTSSLLATYVGGGLLAGIIFFGYQGGAVGVWIGLSYSFFFFALGFLAPGIRGALRNRGVGSFVKFVEDAYGRRISQMVGGVYLIIFILFLCAQFIALRLVSDVFFDFSGVYLILLCSMIILVYTCLSGFRGVLLTDLVQLIVLVSVIVFLLVPALFEEDFIRFSNLPESYLLGTEMGVVFAVGSLLFAGMSLLVRIDAWDRIHSSKDAKTARISLCLTGFLILPFFVVYSLLGMDAKLLGIGVADEATLLEGLLNRYFTSQLLVLCVAGSFLAAIISSADSLVHSLVLNYIHNKESLRVHWDIIDGELDCAETSSKVKVSQTVINREYCLSAFAIVFVASSVSVLFPDIVSIIVVATSLLVIFVPMTVGALILPKANGRAAIASLAGGIGAFVVAYPFMNNSSFVPAFAVSLTAYGLVHVRARGRKIGDASKLKD